MRLGICCHWLTTNDIGCELIACRVTFITSTKYIVCAGRMFLLLFVDVDCCRLFGDRQLHCLDCSLSSLLIISEQHDCYLLSCQYITLTHPCLLTSSHNHILTSIPSTFVLLSPCATSYIVTIIFKIKMGYVILTPQ